MASTLAHRRVTALLRRASVPSLQISSSGRGFCFEARAVKAGQRCRRAGRADGPDRRPACACESCRRRSTRAATCRPLRAPRVPAGRLQPGRRAATSSGAWCVVTSKALRGGLFCATHRRVVGAVLIVDTQPRRRTGAGWCAQISSTGGSPQCWAWRSARIGYRQRSVPIEVFECVGGRSFDAGVPVGHGGRVRGGEEVSSPFAVSRSVRVRRASGPRPGRSRS